MFENKDVMKIAPIIVGVCNWSVLAGLVAAVEYGLPEGAVKNAVRGVVYASFLGSAVVGFLGRKKRAGAKIYNDRVYTHDPDSGRIPHMGYIARVNVPNVLVNPWTVFSPIMADVVRLCMINGSLSCTPKTVKWLSSSDGVRWNIDPIGCNEVVSGKAAEHLRMVIDKLNKADELTQQQKDMKDGIEKMLKNGLKIE